MADLHWFKIYAAEILSDERFQGWTIDERGAWFTLICVAWREGSIPGDQETLARLLHVDSNTMRLLWSAIGNRFVSHPDHPGRLTSPRLEIEREDAKRLREKKADAGRKGAEIRWKKPNGSAMAVPLQTNAEPMAKHSAQPSQAQPSAAQPSQPGNDEWLAGFREKLAQRLGVPEIDIGKDRARVLTLFRQQLDAVGEDVLLTDCVAAAKRSETGVPSSLAWFVGWLKRLPTEATA